MKTNSFLRTGLIILMLMFFAGSVSAKDSVILEASDVVMIYNDGTDYVVKLTDSQGNPLANQNIVITIGDRVYNEVTDDSGMVSVNIPSMFPKEYDITASFEETENYFSKKLVNSLLIKPIPIAIILEDEYVFDYDEEIRINGAIAGLPTGEHIIVYLKVNNRTYSFEAAQHKGSLITFENIPKLDAGNYTITAYINNQYYAADEVNSALIINDNTGLNAINITAGIYPNPAERGQAVTIKTRPLDNATLEIINSAGARIQQQPIAGESHSVTMPAIPGIYLIKIHTSEAEGTVKVTVK